MPYIVEFPNQWYLRGTTATGDIERANRFPTETDAHLAIEKASRFMKRAAIKGARIIRAPR